MTLSRFLPHLLAATFCLAILSPRAHALAPSGEDWFTIITPHFRVHHTLPLESYARAVAQTVERQLPELEKRLNWTPPDAVDIIVMDPSDSANGMAMNYPNTYIELLSSPFGSDTPLAYYINWTNEIASHELTHIVANDGTRGFYKTLRWIFGSWVKPNGLQPVWLSEGLAVFQETSLTGGGRGRSPLLEAMLREAVHKKMLNDPSYTSIDRFNDGVPWWPAGNTQYLLGYTIQALPTKETPNLPGKVSFENADTIIFAPNRVLHDINGQDWADVWSSASLTLAPRYTASTGPEITCKLTQSGRYTGGQALSPDGWLYFSEEDWDYGYHLARVRSDSPCGKGEVERLTRKEYSGPSQVAVSPSGKLISYAALDPGYETEFSDVYTWSEAHGVSRITKDQRTRDPAFLDDHTLLFIRANANTGESLVQHDLTKDSDTVLFTGQPLQRLSGLTVRAHHVLFSLHNNDGHEKIVELRGGQPVALLKMMDPSREFERNPYLTADGTLYFAASYGHGPQEIYRFDPSTQGAVRVLSSESGFLDRPILLADGKTIVVQSYGLSGLDLARAPLDPALANTPVKATEPPEDLHEYLTGEKPQPIPEGGIELPPSVPYSIADSGTSLWPHYWFPEITAGQDGVLAGASTSGNDALNYHRYYAIAQYDSRANFPSYLAYYRNRTYTTNFHFQAEQSNDYFMSRKTSNRNSTYSLEAIFPLWDTSLSFGTAYRQKRYFGSQTNNALFYQNLSYDRSGSTPSAIAPNWGIAFNNFTAAYPSSKNESTFFDVRPEAQLYFRGLHPSHSVSVSAALGITTNHFLSTNYYLGGGASPLSNSPYIVRGYPTDALIGQRVATGNFAYTLPLAHLYHGIGTCPLFLSDLGLRFMGDAGSANNLSVYSGNNFQALESSAIGKKILYGVGADVLANGSIFYHVPVNIETGVHYGTNKRYGGGYLFYLALNLGINRGTLRARNASHLLERVP